MGLRRNDKLISALRHNWRIPAIIALVTIATQLFLLWAYLNETRENFYAEIRHYFLVGVVITVVYKHFIVFMMALTDGKKPLDRSFIWQTEAVGILFVFSYASIQWPLWLFHHPVLSGWLWLNMWVDVALSSAFVVYYLYTERIRPIIRYIRWNGWPDRKLLLQMLRGKVRYE